MVSRLLGGLRDLLSTEPKGDGRLRALDHDFGSHSNEEKAIPYGVYDTVANEAFVYLATGSDTGELAADALRRWWYRMGRRRYADAGGLLVLADCGGSNGYRVALYREQLQNVAQKLGLPIRVAHLPPYCSKYNLIDHRLFCHLTRAISGRLVESLSWLQLLFSQVTTRSGLKVICELARKSYQAGIKASQAFRDNDPTIRDECLGQFNYTLSPSNLEVISEQFLCEGDGGTAIESALEGGRLFDFFTLVDRILNTYNPGSPHVSLNAWNGTSCGDCGGSYDEDNCTTCERCATTICLECSVMCEGCSEPYCEDCSDLCELCGEKSCVACLDRCSKCNSVVCQNCLSEQANICERCHEQETQQPAGPPTTTITAA